MFKTKIVTALMSLRTDLTKQEKAEANKICKDIIENFREDLVADQKGKKSNKGIFSQLDTSKAIKGGGKETIQEEQKEASESEDDGDFNVDDFLREGGLNMVEEEKKKEIEEFRPDAVDDVPDTEPDE